MDKNPYTLKVAEYFGYPFDFEFLELFCSLLCDVLDDQKEEPEKDIVDVAFDVIDRSLIYNCSIWRVMAFYQLPEEADLRGALGDLAADLAEVARSVLAGKEDQK